MCVSTADITPSSDGHIEVEASGGTIPYTFTLLPDSTLQGYWHLHICTWAIQGSYVVEVKDAKGLWPGGYRH